MFNKNIITIAIISSTLVGCKLTVDEIVNPSPKNVVIENTVAKKTVLDESIESVSLKMENIGEEKSGYYINTKNKIIKKETSKFPFSFTKNIEYFNDDFISGNVFASDIYKIAGVKVDFVDDSILISPLTHKNGSLEDLFNYISVTNDIKWKYDADNEKVFFYKYSTREYQISDQYLINSDNIYMIESDIKSLVSDDAKYSFNFEQGIIVVEDTDFNLLKINNYINKTNDLFNKKMFIEFSTYTAHVNVDEKVKLSDIKNTKNISYSVSDSEGVSSKVFDRESNVNFDNFISSLKEIGTVEQKSTTINVLNNSESLFTLNNGKNISLKPKISNENIIISYSLNDDESGDINQTISSKNGEKNIILFTNKTIQKNQNLVSGGEVQEIVIVTATPYYKN